MHPRVEEWLRRGPVLTDGAWGTELQARGLEAGELPDLWNFTYPERVESVARAYVESGSQIVLTNTFRASRIALGEQADVEGSDFVRELNVEAVRISKRAARDRALVFASIGPSGKLLLTREVTEARLSDAFDEQAAALAAGGADGIVVETMVDLTEARLATRAAKATGLPVVSCMVFDSGVEGDRTMMGVTLEEAAEELCVCGADVIGANCGKAVESYLTICQRLSDAVDLPIWVKPNAGAPEFIDGRACYKTTPEAFASQTATLVRAGASFVGGCCGTSPRFIRELGEELQRLRASE